MEAGFTSHQDAKGGGIFTQRKKILIQAAPNPQRPLQGVRNQGSKIILVRSLEGKGKRMVKLGEQQNQRTFSFLFGKIKGPEQFHRRKIRTSPDKTKVAYTLFCPYSSRTELSKDETIEGTRRILLMTLQTPKLSVVFNSHLNR